MKILSISVASMSRAHYTCGLPCRFLWVVAVLTELFKWLALGISFLKEELLFVFPIGCSSVFPMLKCFLVKMSHGYVSVFSKHNLVKLS